MNKPRLDIDFGPMFSGKTQNLYRKCTRMADAIQSVRGPLEGGLAKEVLLITDKNQARQSASNQKGLSTHTYGFSCSPYLKIKEVSTLSEITEEDIRYAVLIGIDEGFYPDLYEKVLFWYLERNISIAIACIDGSYKQESITPQVYQLIPYATSIRKHHAICTACLASTSQATPAYYTIKTFSSNTSNGGGQDVEYGGYDKYRPVCLDHLRKHRLEQALVHQVHSSLSTLS